MADDARLRATLSLIQANPQLWDQGSWWDCFAALAVELAGYTVLPSLWVRLPGRSVQVWDAAAEVLDLTGPQARRLFHPDNSLADLCALVAEFAAAGPVRVHLPRHAGRLSVIG